MRIPESTLSEIQNRLDIAEVIGEYVALQRKGGRYWGLCPFHQEKSPSFTVTPEKGVYYCFGCQKGGGLFQFIMDVEKLEWRDAVELLAKKAGIEIPRGEDRGEGAKRRGLLELNKRVAGSFHWLLCEDAQAESARKYLASRGVSRPIMDSFQLGYAPPERERLHRFLMQKSYSEEFLSQTGLFMQGSRSGAAALFANRDDVPDCQRPGGNAGFRRQGAGRCPAQVLNSPETAFFRKGEFLRPRQGSSWACIRHISDCVAPLGTATKESQVPLP